MKTVTTNNIVTITTPAILSDDSLRLFGKGIKGSKVRLLEGDKTNWIPSFFEGMQSSFEDKLVTQEMIDSGEEIADNLGKYKVSAKVIGKNLFDIDKVKVAVNILDKGSNYIIVNNNTIDMSYCCDFNPNSQYTLSWELEKIENNNMAGFEFIYTDGTDNYCIRDIKGTLTSIPGKTISKIRITFNDNGKSKISNIQIEEGDTATEYAPYKENKIQLSSIEPLRGVNEIHDRLVFKDGKLMIERNCKSATFDGSADEDWWVSSTQIDGYNCYVIRLNDALIDYHLNEKMLCDKVYVNNDRKLNTIIPLVIDDNTAIGLYYTDSSINVTDFKNKLKSNPITVVYPLAEPTYEEIPYELQKIILESYNNGTLFIDTNIPPTKVSFNCFGEELTYLYPSTSYTVQFTSDKAITADITLGGTELLSQSIVQGLNKISITTPNTLVDNKLIINGTGAKISDVVVTDTNREFKYFEGMKSVGENGLKIYSGKPQRFGKGGRI